METGQKREFLDVWIVDPFNRIIKNSKASGIVLFSAALLALILANSPWSEEFHHFWELKFAVGFNGNFINKSLHHWINDGLMAMFFFVVGLELKRELVAGELSTPGKALLPISAAIGGMVLPALIYLLFNDDPVTRTGWGIPMATDIAFALGVLYLLGDRVPSSLKVFLTAIAIVDDLGAVLIIAFFYTSEIDLGSLAVGALIFGLMIGGNLLGVRNTLFYGTLGIGGLWLAFLLSGVHATIAAVLAAFTIPATTRIDEKLFKRESKDLVRQFEAMEPTEESLVSHDQYYVLKKLRKLSKNAIPPLQRLEHTLHPIVAFLIMPIFALSNAGVTLSQNVAEYLNSGITVGIVIGLMLGKVIGVAGLSYLLVKTGLLNLPARMTMLQILGVAFLCAVGFTMSLFIASLAFTRPDYLLQAKLGVLIASLIASVTGYFIIRRTLGGTEERRN